MLTIGDKLKYIRESLEITQKQVSIETGINSKTLSGYENNVSSPDLDTLRSLLIFYGVSADTVLEIPPAKFMNFKESKYKSVEYSEDEKSLIDSYRQLSDIKKAEIRGEIKGILRTTQEQQSATNDNTSTKKVI